MVYIIKFNIHKVAYVLKAISSTNFLNFYVLHLKLQTHVMANQKSNGVAARLVALAVLEVETVTKIRIVLGI